MANAGLDHENVPKRRSSLWPEDPFKEADEIRRKLVEKTRRRISVVLVDSRVTPLRRGVKDLYGKPLKITYNLLERCR